MGPVGDKRPAQMVMDGLGIVNEVRKEFGDVARTYSPTDLLSSFGIPEHWWTPGSDGVCLQLIVTAFKRRGYSDTALSGVSAELANFLAREMANAVKDAAGIRYIDMSKVNRDALESLRPDFPTVVTALGALKGCEFASRFLRIASGAHYFDIHNEPHEFFRKVPVPLTLWQAHRDWKVTKAVVDAFRLRKADVWHLPPRLVSILADVAGNAKGWWFFKSVQFHDLNRARVTLEKSFSKYPGMGRRLAKYAASKSTPRVRTFLDAMAREYVKVAGIGGGTAPGNDSSNPQAGSPQGGLSGGGEMARMLFEPMPFLALPVSMLDAAVISPGGMGTLSFGEAWRILGAANNAAAEPLHRPRQRQLRLPIGARAAKQQPAFVRNRMWRGFLGR